MVKSELAEIGQGYVLSKLKRMYRDGKLSIYLGALSLSCRALYRLLLAALRTKPVDVLVEIGPMASSRLVMRRPN
jgi:hypothetical protein